MGFFLTTVLGGGLAYFFQARGWAHQHDVAKREGQREQGFKAFEEISNRLDKRLYRMRRLYWAAAQKAKGRDIAQEWETARSDYREVLYEWNDNLNRTLALVETYFGERLRVELEDVINEEFATLHRALNIIVRLAEPPDAKPLPRLRFGLRLSRLSDQIYGLNVQMLRVLEGDALKEQTLPLDLQGNQRGLGHPVLQLGAQGEAVKKLQRALNDDGRESDRVDGEFDLRTYRAVRSFQINRQLDADGVVGPRTWAALESNDAD